MGWIVCVGLLLAVTGCESDGGYASSGYRGRSSTQVAAYQDDYDYYPGYETYYSRNRHEYVYRDGNSWVRRSQPRGVTVDALRTAPTVRMNFHDAPEQHHTETIKTYPHNWRDTNHDGKIDEKDRRDQRDNDRR